jgi:hypothetical protein
MNGIVRYELANVMIADRLREADRNRIVAQARAARRADQAATRSGQTVTRRVRALLRARTA